MLIQVRCEHPELPQCHIFCPILGMFQLSDCGKGKLELLNVHLAPGAELPVLQQGWSCTGDAGTVLYQRCGPRLALHPHPSTGQGMRLRNRILILKVRSSARFALSWKKKVKKSFLQRSLLLVTPFVERSLAGAAGKKQNVFSEGSLKRGREGEKNPNPQKNPRAGGKHQPRRSEPLALLGRCRNPLLGLSSPCCSHVLRERGSPSSRAHPGIRDHKSPILNR